MVYKPVNTTIDLDHPNRFDSLTLIIIRRYPAKIAVRGATQSVHDVCVWVSKFWHSQISCAEGA